MTNPEAGEVSSGAATEPAPQNLDAKSAFLEKVNDIPVVQAAKEYSTAAYNQVKLSNPLANYTLNKAESTILYFALAAKPFLNKIQPQAKLIDDMAVLGLEVVENKAPFIMKTPEEMISEARKLCALTLETSYQKANEMKDLSSGAISSVKSFGLQKVGDCLSNTEKLVDHYLPPALGEGSDTSVESKNLSEQATHLTTKVGQRVYGHSMKQFLQMQQLSQDSIAKLVYTIELLQQVKENYKGKTVQELADEAKVKATWIWEELSKEPTDASEADKSLEQRMLSFARRVTSTLVHTYSAVPVGKFPKVCMDSIQTARHYAAELFTQLDQAINSGEVGSTLQKARETIFSLEGVIKGIVKENETIEMQNLTPEDGASDEKQ